MEKNAMIGPDTPDLDQDPPLGRPPRQKQAAVQPKKTVEELDSQDPEKHLAEAVKAGLKGTSK
jgi:hypothetical protein